MTGRPMLKAANLADLDRVRHGFFTRMGGVSRGEFESLNCGYSGCDDVALVEHNRALALERLGGAPASLCTVRQVHGTAVVVARAAEPGRPSRSADALVTDRPAVTLGVLSADCAPVLLADRAAGVIGAAHAGWRGALAGVVEATVEAMVSLGARPERISAAVGPCIAQASYEVGPDLHGPVVALDPESAALFLPVPGGDRLLFDLKGYVLRRLARAGVADRDALTEDTCADEARFFSARRTRRRGGERFGLMLSAITLVD
ncbi:MAG TPA: peptidoglycan editing factor PgeF [Geminicoccaceae bacterium]|nr:peptidoglycan editing factor PgeF [Geminicoccaceae bacterium]